MAWHLTVDMDLGIQGLWWGLASGQLFLGFMYCFFVAHTDWNEVAIDFAKKVELNELDQLKEENDEV